MSVHRPTRPTARSALIFLALALAGASLLACNDGGGSTEPTAETDSETPGDSGQTVGLFTNDSGAQEGYTLFTPLNFDTTYLLDNEGRLVHSWDTPDALSGYLEEDGTLLATTETEAPSEDLDIGGGTGAVAIYDWAGAVQWRYEYSDETHRLHHDAVLLPNGNVLMLAFQVRSAEEAIAAGRDPALLDEDVLIVETLIEVAPAGPDTGDIVWEWDVWDHLVQDFDPSKANYGVVAEHPELVDINFSGPEEPGSPDWLHANALSYNEQLDQIVVSMRSTSELWVIDHGTTTEEAAGHAGGERAKGGDLLYRWGNPQAYDAGTEADRQAFFQHDVNWIQPGLDGAGDILLFNNGPREDGEYSTVTQIPPPVDGDGNYELEQGEPYGPLEPAWSYEAGDGTDLYSAFISSARRLPNGNTFIDEGGFGRFLEVTEDGEVVWEYVSPVGTKGPLVQGQAPAESILGADTAAFRAYRYPRDFPGLEGRDLTPREPLETDSDGDGASDLAELAYYRSDPAVEDSDGDGYLDGEEGEAGSDPADPASTPLTVTPTPTRPAPTPEPTPVATPTPG
jgi:hypothetical protein